MKRGPFRIAETEHSVVNALIAKILREKSVNPKVTLISYAELSKLLSPAEIELIDRVTQTDPTLYGFKGPYVGLEEPSDDLVALEGQHYLHKGVQEEIGTQYLPRPTLDDYSRLKGAIKEDIDSDLLVESSYRSPAYQALTFLHILQIYDFDVKKTASRCAVPGYSEHGTLSSLALDFINQDGTPNDEDPQAFQYTKEYKWLLENAGDYHFYLSYPKDNEYGVMFEPWHWRHK